MNTYNTLSQVITKTTTQSDSNLINYMLITKKKAFNSRTQAQTEFYGIDFEKNLVKLNELYSTLSQNSST